MLRWKSSLKPAAAAPAADITFEDSAVTSATSFASPTNIDVNIPAVSTDDILILFSTTNDFSEPTDSPPSGWTKIVEKDGDQSGHSTVAAYWKRASSSSVATTETWSSFFPNGEYYYIWVGAYSGCATSGSPVDAYGTASFGFSSSWSVDVTTTVDNAMVVTISGSTNNSVTQTWADGTELIDTTYASEAAVSINEKLEATSGAKTRSSTASTNTSASMIAVALKPASGTTYLFDENFEGTGTPAGFTNSISGSGTIDYDHTTNVLEGSKSLHVYSDSNTYAYLDLGLEYDHIVAVFGYYNVSVSNRTDVAFCDGDLSRNAYNSLKYGSVSSFDKGINHDFSAVLLTLTGTINTFHYVRVEIDKTNGVVKIARSNDKTSFPTSGTNYAEDLTAAFDSRYGGTRYILFGFQNSTKNSYYDDIEVTEG